MTTAGARLVALRHHGLAGYRAAIEHDLAQADRLVALVRDAPDLELLAPPSLSIVRFRYAPASLRADPARLDALNRATLEAVQLGGGAFLSGTVLTGRFALRACIVNPRSTPEDIATLVAVVREIGARLVDAGQA